MATTLNNTNIEQAKNNTNDLEVFGDGDAWKLICKASSDSEGWMKSTKAYEIPYLGCLVQVTTQKINPDSSWSCAEAVTFVPGAKILTHCKGDEVTSRELVADDSYMAYATDEDDEGDGEE